jgi:CubicO group peptidase (beta-lactamase class C family)
VTETTTQRLARIADVVRADVAAGLYHGAVIKVAQGGQTLFEQAVGCADEAQTQPLSLSSVFSIFSVTKAFTNLLCAHHTDQRADP